MDCSSSNAFLDIVRIWVRQFPATLKDSITELKSSIIASFWHTVKAL